MNEKFLEEMDYLEITQEQREYILKELKDVSIQDEEGIVINESGQFNEAGETIYTVSLSNGDIDRFICYI